MWPFFTTQPALSSPSPVLRGYKSLIFPHSATGSQTRTCFFTETPCYQDVAKNFPDTFRPCVGAMSRLRRFLVSSYRQFATRYEHGKFSFDELSSVYQVAKFLFVAAAEQATDQNLRMSTDLAESTEEKTTEEKYSGSIVSRLDSMAIREE